MKNSLLLLVCVSSLAGASFGLVGCVGEVGVAGPGPGYYDDGPYAYGHPYYHEHESVIIGGGYRGGWDRGGWGEHEHGGWGDHERGGWRDHDHH